MAAFPEEHYTAWTRDTQQSAAEQLSALGRQITGWLVVGNAAALVLAFNAAVQGSTRSPWLLRTSASTFAWGLALAFSAAVASWIGGIVAVSFLSRVNALAEQMYGHHSTFEKGKFGTKSGP